MSLISELLNLLKSLFGNKQTASEPTSPDAPTQTRQGYIDGTDMKESNFLAMTGGNSQNSDEIKRKLQSGCAKGQYPFTFSVGGWMYTITKIADNNLHEQYGLQYTAVQKHK